MLLNGTTSRSETTGLGGVSSSIGAVTLAALVRRSTAGTWDNMIAFLTSGNVTLLDLTIADTNVLTMEYQFGNSAGPALSPTTGPMYLAADKPSGAATPRFHKQIYGTDAVVAHSAGSGSITPSGTVAKISVGSFDNNADWFAGDIYAVAAWSRVLADWEHDLLAGSLGAWLFLSPDWLIIELASSLPANIPDLSGKGAPLTTLTNLSVSTVSLPVGWGAPMPETFPAPGGAGSQTITPGFISSGAQVFAPTLAPGAVTIAPGFISSTEQIFAPTLSSKFTLTPNRVESTEQVFAPSLSPGAVTLTPSLVGSTAQVFSPTFGGQSAVQPSRIESTEQVFGPSLVPGPIIVVPGFLSSGAQVFAPTLVGGTAPTGPPAGTLLTLGVGR